MCGAVPRDDPMKKAFQNFWYYYKIPVIIVFVLLAAGLYFLLQPKTPESDYEAAVISGRGCSDEQLAAIQNALQTAGRDRNGDGTVIVKMNIYRFEIGAEGQDINAIAGLDADLVGKASGIFFAEDPEAFEEVSNGIVNAVAAVPLSEVRPLAGNAPENLFLMIRTDAEEKYTELFSALTAK